MNDNLPRLVDDQLRMMAAMAMRAFGAGDE
jgi:hypothetical protein